jgi:hypothetical protein
LLLPFMADAEELPNVKPYTKLLSESTTPSYHVSQKVRGPAPTDHAFWVRIFCRLDADESRRFS